MPILAAKLYIPPLRPNLVSRPRLIQRLQADLWQPDVFLRRLTLISAPPGYGKTMLAVDWLRRGNFPFAWCSLDGNDNDPARFLSYLIAALKQVDPQIGKGILGMLQAPQPPPPEVILATLVNEIAEVAQPLILALDDYHHIHAPPVHQVLIFLLEYQPANMHTLIITREDPPIPIARLRAGGYMAEVRQSELCFTLEEVSDYFQHSIGLALHPDDIRALAQRTEGWIAGLHMAALSMRRSADLHGFVQSFTGSSRYILDYLFEEVLTKQSAGIQDFLLKTSILDRLSAPLCDAVTGRSDSNTLLHELDSANLFIETLDPSNEWYRVHPLFKELLRHRLGPSLRSGTLGEISEPDLYLRASRWYEQNGFFEDAVDHALLAGDWGLAATLVVGGLEAMLKRGAVTTLINWFKRVPEVVVRSNPRLCLAYAWPLLLASQHEPADALLTSAEKLAGEQPDLLGDIAAAQAYLAQVKGDGLQLVECSERALALMPSSNRTGRCLVALNLAIAYWHAGRMEDTRKSLDIALPTARDTSNEYALATAMIFRVRIRVVRGQLRLAEKDYWEILGSGLSVSILALVHYDLATLYYEWNDLSRAAEHIQQGMEASQHSGNVEFQIAGFLLLARLRQSLGDPKGAIEAINQARQISLASHAPLRADSRLTALQVEIALEQENLEEAERLSRDLPDDVDAHTFYRFLGLTKARLWIVQGRKAQAAQVLQASLIKAIQAEWEYGVITLRVLQTLAADTPATALEFLSDALNRAQPEGYIRTFADAGKPLVPLLIEAARRGIYPEYAGQILAAINAVTSATSKSPVSEMLAQVEPLSEREIEVLRLVAAGLSNREIAVTLYISPGTAKTHIHNICGKLGARNRTEATARANELGLV